MASIGRDFLIKKGGTTLIGLRTKTMSVNGEAVDVTNDDSLGWRKLLSVSGTKSIDISFDGISEDELIQDLAWSGGTELMLTDVTLHWPLRSGDITAATASCDFFLSNFEQSGTYNDAVTFSASLLSSGIPDYTAAV